MSLVTVSLVSGCGDDDELSLDQAADVDNDAAAVTELHGAADVSFGGLTAAVSGVTCTNESRFIVSPIVAETFTLTVDGDPAAGQWFIVVTEPGDPAMVWNVVDPDRRPRRRRARRQRPDAPRRRSDGHRRVRPSSSTADLFPGRSRADLTVR